MLRLNSMLLNKQWNTEEIKEEIKKKYLETNNKEGPKLMVCSKSSSTREIYSSTSLPQETRKINNLTLYLKQLEEKNDPNPKLGEGKKS